MKASARVPTAIADQLPCAIPVGMPQGCGIGEIREGRCFRANKANLFAIPDKLLEVLTADFPLTGREAGTAYVRKFIENVKAEGLEKAGLRGAVEE
jgi:hypothetical protein